MLVTTRVHVQRKRKLGFFDGWLLGSFAAYHAYRSVLGNPNETTNPKKSSLIFVSKLEINDHIAKTLAVFFYLDFLQIVSKLLGVSY